MAVAKKRIALVTGVSRGIGKAVAAALRDEGYDVIGTCRSPRRLAREDRLSGVRYLGLDLASPRSIAALAKQAGPVALLVNSAGESLIGPAEEAPMDRVRRHFQVNLFGPLQLTQALLPGMRARGAGMIVCIGSMRAEAPSPFSPIYSASKSALRSLAQCLRMEVKPFGVRVAVVSPWHIRTTLPQERMLAPRSPYAAALTRVKARRDEMIANAAPPEAVARAVVRVSRSRRPPSFTSVGKAAFLQSFLIRHLPRGLVERSSARRFGLKG
jgi:short-subunit dehydrogenase